MSPPPHPPAPQPLTPPQRARDAWAAWRAEARVELGRVDAHLISVVSDHGHADVVANLEAFAAQLATIDDAVCENNRDEHLPTLRRWDGQGNRIEQVVHHDSYHQIGRVMYGGGAMAGYATPGRELPTLAQVYLAGRLGEAGHTCPMACTAGLIKILQRHRETFAPWLARLLDANYDTHLHGAQFLTEAQGGADVGANALLARTASPPPGANALFPPGSGAAGADKSDRLAWVTLHGEKWFCSVADAQLMLVTARPEGAGAGTKHVRTYVMPRHLPNGELNRYALRRLKFKLGTRSMASAEIDFEGAWAVDVGDFKDAVEIVLNTSRLYNAAVGAGMMQRALIEARAYAAHRTAFGRPIIEFPVVARTLARINAEVHGARAVTFALAALADRLALAANAGATTEHQDHRDAFRMLVNLNKFWVSEACTAALRDAIEVLGGNGAIEEFSVLPRLLRDSVVCEQWEGPHNVLCAQIVRDARERKLDAAMWRYLDSLGAFGGAAATAKGMWGQLHAWSDGDAQLLGRDLLAAMRPHMQAMFLQDQPSLVAPHPPAGEVRTSANAAAALLIASAPPLPPEPTKLRHAIATLIAHAP